MNWILMVAEFSASGLDATAAYAADALSHLAQFIPKLDKTEGLPDAANTLIGRLLWWMSLIGYVAGGAAMIIAGTLLGIGYITGQGKHQQIAKPMLVGGTIGVLIIGVVPTLINEIAGLN